MQRFTSQMRRSSSRYVSMFRPGKLWWAINYKSGIVTERGVNGFDLTLRQLDLVTFA